VFENIDVVEVVVDVDFCEVGVLVVVGIVTVVLLG
jgi:hypothetical protein